ncbi:hypothetical protein GC102_08775 [Paenibacillus sp. LMG 31460]|uniref:Uncharacterized protein n=1 Tax=Paenibacillus germinis TaxID=2654979 RepID=A0ABX1Z1U7_9BACL|nr:hypothetical protein [Paenibacillus germinis]NOU85865.1 hypothetical protein [Paenibacillus germinis]
MNTPLRDPLKELIHLQDERLDQFLVKRRTDLAAGREPDPLGIGTLAMTVPLYCQPASRYYLDAGINTLMREAVDHFLLRQLESGCISLVNCNIDSPPDTAFMIHLVSLVYQVAERSGLEQIRGIQDGLFTFMVRARPCLLTGGIHTPNHRWVMAGALAKMYEIFGDEAYRERAFQFLDEGFDMTEYGEWTERSNAIYNGACAIHLYDVGVIFGYEPAFEAIRKNLGMMQYMLHPDQSVATEYSGRQDLGQTMMMNDWYYVIYHLMASLDKNPVFLSMAQITEETSPKGASALIHWMLYPEAMCLPDNVPALSENYTILLGEGNEALVPRNIPYLGKLVQHPHGASVLRHRKGKLSVTLMAAQPELMYIQHGKARMFGLKLAAGWFGIGAVAFPSIKQTGMDRYSMDIELEGCYFQPLPKEHFADKNGIYVNMPNHLREKTNIQHLQLALEFQLLTDGVEVSIRSKTIPGIYLQAVCMFDSLGELSGDGLEQVAPHMKQLVNGDAVFSLEGDCIRVSSGAKEHIDVSMRNEKVNRDALNVTMNYVTPTDVTIRFQAYACEGESQ